MMFRVLSYIFLAFVVGLGSPYVAATWAAPVKAPTAAAQGLLHSDKILAVVNDQVITQNQIATRTALNLRQLGLVNPSAEQQNAVFRRTLSGMIDEELQRQFAARAKISLSKTDIKKGKAAVIASMGGPATWKKLTQGLEATAEDKVESEMLWDKISEQAIKPHVQVGMAEVDKLLEELAKSRHVVERQIAMIMLGAGDTPEADKERLKKLQDIKKQLDETHDFSALARTYSEDKSAAKGGELGWFGAGELNPQLEEALDKMQPGQISDIIRTPVGWHLIKLENVRTTKPIDTKPITQVQVYMLAAPTPKDEKAQKDLAEKLNTARKNLATQKDIAAYFQAKSYTESFPESADLGYMTPTDLQPTLQEALKAQKPNSWSKLTQVGNNTALLFTGGTREVMPANLDAYRSRVMDNMYNNRLELETRRFLQELRQRAFVDVRL